MSARRIAIAVSAALVGALTGAAPSAVAAKPAPKCPMISDPAGDYDGNLPSQVGAAAYDSALDIISANAWVDGKTLHTFLRVARLPSTEVAGRTLYGRQWTVRLITAEDFPLYVSLVSRDGYDWPLAYTETGDKAFYPAYPGASFSYDRKANAIRVNVPLTSVGADASVKRGSRWVLDRALTFRMQGNPTIEGPPLWLGPGGVGDQVDAADGNRVVVVGKPECAS